MSSTKLFTEILPPLLPGILDTLQEMNFLIATPVQGAVIPYFLSHKDVNVSACTGSGKTLSFLIPLFHTLLKSDSNLKAGNIGGIIISPTRELALQTFNIAQQFEKHMGRVKVVLLTGGNEITDDMKQLQSENILVLIATPGRLKDIMERQGDKLPLRDLEVLILDEADVLLDLGHALTIGAILSKLPKQRRTGLFSATETDGITALCKAGLRNPIRIKIEIKNQNVVQAVPVLLKNYYVTLTSDEKLGFETRNSKIILFFLTCASVDYFYSVLRSIPSLSTHRLLSLHGRMVPKKRLKTMEEFRSSQPSVLLCTDVAARGIDIPDIDWIVQYAPPQDPAFFIHRVGRTARAGREGKSVLLLEPSEGAYVPFTRKRGVPLVELGEDMWSEGVRESSKEEGVELLRQVKVACCEDRELYEKGVTAFVADIRAYRNHDCNFLLRFDDLDLSSMATAFALPRLPKMSELRSRKVDYDELDIDVRAIPFKDEARELARQERIKRETIEWEAKMIKGEGKKEKKEKKEEKEKEKKKKKGKHEKIMNEWEELQEEERLYRLLKKKKINEEEYDRLLTREKDEEEENGVEKISKDHQMMRNVRKSKKSKATRSRNFKK